jgi:predicted tellurium resistance membrane protein TerC/Mg2+/Co2+ transporter CorC
MEWLTDPSAWVGLLTLIVLEVVLGIDNLVFITILVDKLPPEQADRARKLGLSMALGMRLALLAAISGVTALTEPVFSAFTVDFSWRDLILISGGLFLLIKATIEIHDRLEATSPDTSRASAYSSFWTIVAQIVVLDAVFSLDSIITAVGMVDDIQVMMVAVVISVIIMLFASKPLGAFVNAHPSVIILCLGFLLMVGFALVVEGFGVHIPKGYLYAAIGFSVLIETLNQLALRSRRALEDQTPLRHRAAQAVLRLIGGVPLSAGGGAANDVGAITPDLGAGGAFAPVEKDMVRGVLTLSDRTIGTIMTPRVQVQWVDIAESKAVQLTRVRTSPHRWLIVSRGEFDQVVGVARKDAALEQVLTGQSIDLMRLVREPLVVHEGLSILKMIELFKRDAAEIAVVVDEYGRLQGIATRSDVLRAIAGNLPEELETEPGVKDLGDKGIVVDGELSLFDAQAEFDLNDVPKGESTRIAGFILSLFGRLPKPGETIDWRDWRFEVMELDGFRIKKVIARRIAG